MKFTIDKKELFYILQIAQDVISAKNFVSILSNISMSLLKNTLTLQATDTNTYFKASLLVDNFSEDEKSITIHCETCYRAVQSLIEKELTFEMLEENRLILTPSQGNVKFTMNTLPFDEFPSFIKAPEDVFFSLSREKLEKMIHETVFAVSDDESRFFMNGVYMQIEDNNLLFVATDGKRLSYSKTFLSDVPTSFDGVIIPPKILKLLMKLLQKEGEVKIGIYEKTIYFSFQNIIISSILIEGPFPDYMRVIPKTQDYSLNVKTSHFINALKRVSLFTEKSKRIFCLFAKNTITLYSEEIERGYVKETIFCEYEGPEMKFSFNYQYLLDPLLILNDEVNIKFSDPHKVITITGDENSIHIIMPMRVDA